MNGIVILDKPAGITSFKATSIVRKIFKAPKAGHAGTLDPFATGLLIICLNKATRLVSYFQEGMKTYQARLRLGQETDTYDRTGQITDEKEMREFNNTDIQEVLNRFLGEIAQKPPAFSALKIDGQRAYKKARKGTPVEMTARNVTVSAIELNAFTWPYLDITVSCSKGTYIRSLAFDIGRELGCGAHLSDLRRTQSGQFSIAAAVSLDTLRQDPERGLTTLEDVTVDFPTVHFDDVGAERVRHGQAVPLADAEFSEIDAVSQFRALGSNGQVVALGYVKDGSTFIPKIVV